MVVSSILTYGVQPSLLKGLRGTPDKRVCTGSNPVARTTKLRSGTQVATRGSPAKGVDGFVTGAWVRIPLTPLPGRMAQMVQHLVGSGVSHRKVA